MSVLLTRGKSRRACVSVSVSVSVKWWWCLFLFLSKIEGRDDLIYIQTAPVGSKSIVPEDKDREFLIMLPGRQ